MDEVWLVTSLVHQNIDWPVGILNIYSLKKYKNVTIYIPSKYINISRRKRENFRFVNNYEFFNSYCVEYLYVKLNSNFIFIIKDVKRFKEKVNGFRFLISISKS